MDDDVQYEVVITDTAREEGEKYAKFILEKSTDSVASDRWWNGLLAAIFSLEILPARCAFIDEDAGRDLQVRQLCMSRTAFSSSDNRVSSAYFAFIALPESQSHRARCEERFKAEDGMNLLK